MKQYQISDNKGLVVSVIPYGATITSICFNEQELTLNYTKPDDYFNDNFYLGSTVGRFANRIKESKFKLSGKESTLNANQGAHCLHGGKDNFSKRIWEVIEVKPHAIELYLFSKNGDQGFPGNLEVWLKIQVEDNQVSLNYRASTDRNTVVNLTNHCYFNLESPQASIDNHLLEIVSDSFLSIDKQGIPLTKQQVSNHNAFNFNDTKPIHHALLSEHEQIQQANGLDHCFVLANQAENALVLAAQLLSPETRLKLSLYTTLPGVQVYTGNFLSTPFSPRQGVCLEAQYWPDAPNRKDFPSSELKAGEEYIHEIVYQFSAF